eukprot:CAMPEP_0169076022 /NCGR_PEP_ID=MMETSP1015-20121227/8128_1 /TAXON_ID=342587 /ORGANISM="Karlodinium micrum, Strain CCMP2283" /LENGTH=232 /DNA_ID=CAMNT_0009135461 /DNA_START=43 /DNA_END=741 /DNA_ORIENTATION=+
MLDWASIKDTLPVGQSDQDKKKRHELWRDFHAGRWATRPKYLALFEIESGIQSVLQCEELFDAKAAIRRAYRYARDVNPNGPEDELEFCEFRLLLVYLKGLFEIYELFTSLDQSKDKVLSLSELEVAGPRLAAAGIRLSDPGMLWHQLKGSNDVVEFGEFADWAARQGLAGPELLERHQLDDATLCDHLKAAFGSWACASDGFASPADVTRVLKKLDPSWSNDDIALLLSVV